MLPSIFSCSFFLAFMSASELREFLNSLLQSDRVHIIVGFVCSFLFGLVLGRLLFGGKRRDEFSPGVPELEAAPIVKSKAASQSGLENRELEWRHEKLALTERQVAESHRRLGALIDAGASAGLPRELVYPGNTLYYLSETIREERNLLGSDLSRFLLIDKRISKLREDLLSGAGEGLVPPPFTEWRQKAGKCLEEARQHVEIVRDRQRTLRGILNDVSDLERTTFSSKNVDTEFLSKVNTGIGKISRQLDEMSGDGVHAKTAELDKRVLELLQNPPKDDNAEDPRKIDESLYSGLVRILAVDAGDRSDLGKAALTKAATQVQKAFAALSTGASRLRKQTVEGDPKAREKSSAAAIFVDQDGRATEPLSLLPYEEKKRKVVLPDLEDSPVTEEKPEEDFSMVLFCSNRPEWWNRNIYQGSRARAREISEVPGGVNWLGIRRLDTGEQVFCRISKDDLLGSGEGRPVGFNGSNELFYDARHLGLFAESCKGEVETRFTYGGWGFGHKVNGFATEIEPGPPQASGWKGEKIPLDTVFEISVFSKLPADVDDSAVIS